MTKEEQHIDSLIAKYLAGEATGEEQLLLEQWMDESEENKKYFSDIRFVHDKAVSSHPYVKVNTEKAWNSVKEQMKKEVTFAKKTPVKFPQIIGGLWTRVAAGLVILITAAFLLHSLLQKKYIPVTTFSVSSYDSIAYKSIAGTRVTLNRQSTLVFRLNKKDRKKELVLSGEAFIQVKHSTDTTLLVKAGETLIRDIGTSFNVKAYPGEPTIEVYVANGEVTFYTGESSGIHIFKGETGVFDKKLKSFSKVKAHSPNIISYQTRLFVFNNTPLYEAIDKLNSVYPQKILLRNPILADCPITVTFDNENIDSIVEIIAETLGLEVERRDNQYLLNGENCINR